MKPYRDMTDEEWQMVAALLPELRPRAELRGRPLANTRAVLNGVLWVMYSGASWSTLPRKYPSYQTCHRRFKAWHDSGVLSRVMVQLFGPAGESLYSLMSSRMRVPGSVPEVAMEGAAQVHEIVPAAPGIVPPRFVPDIVRRAA
ncbi:transposase [Caballeronia humi]|uniref:Transposase n=1 Tax=Caballeronia humi TaxID=326474 RepID=A0A158FLL3_9BURK|nr:transposase [Caballeronia humi]SAL20738.1 transposase [Caballeronia humi]